MAPLKEKLSKLLLARLEASSQSPYELRSTGPKVSENALQAAKSIRGTSPPALMIFGVMPRSGTVHLGELIRRHPDICAFPNYIFELPMLSELQHLQEFQQSFFHRYPRNKERIEEDDLGLLFGSSVLAYLETFNPDNKTILMKEPRVENLGWFPTLFPYENLLLLMRDGRDVVSSSIRTWPRLKFEDVARRWASSASVMLDFVESHSSTDSVCSIVKFEDVIEKPDAFVTKVCSEYGLALDKFPFEALSDVSVIGSSTISSPGSVDWSQDVTPPNNFKPKGHWMKWDKSRKNAFRRIAGDVLIRAGYESSGAW